MNVAFYAPMKSPDHPLPSGDRHIARLFIKLLQIKGFQVELMSHLRAREGHGDARVQQEIELRGLKVAKQLISDIKSRPHVERPDFWFTYHLYHKAPDWIGPLVATELNIPYVLAEASYAAKQTQGPWSSGLQQVSKALECASTIICLNPRDIPALRQLPACTHKIHKLSPFLDMDVIKVAENKLKQEDIADLYDLDSDLPLIVSVAMMRNHSKLDSYRCLAKSLDYIKHPCQLLLIGDGSARREIENLFSNKIANRTRFTGQLNQQNTLQALLASDIFVWPAINEAIGMAILEAQACGLPVVVGDSGAISGFVNDGTTGFICETSDYLSIAAYIDQLLEDDTLRQSFSIQARENAQRLHSLPAAADQLEQILKSVHY